MPRTSMPDKPLMLTWRAGPYVLLALPAGTQSSPQGQAAYMTPRIDPDSLSYTISCVCRGLPQVAETDTTRPMDVAGEPLL
jgi:hypothetical protein